MDITRPSKQTHLFQTSREIAAEVSFFFEKIIVNLTEIGTPSRSGFVVEKQILFLRFVAHFEVLENQRTLTLKQPSV